MAETDPTSNLGILSPYNHIAYDLPSLDEIEDILFMTEDVYLANGTSPGMPLAGSPANLDLSPANADASPIPPPSSPANSVLCPGNADASNRGPFQVPLASFSGTNMVLSCQNAGGANGMSSRIPPASSRGTNVAQSLGYADVRNNIPFRMPPASSSGNADVVNGISYPMPPVGSPANVGFPPVSAYVANRNSAGLPPVSSSADVLFSPGGDNLENGISFMMQRSISPVRRLVHGPAWSIDWSHQEQATLNRGLQEFASDPVITKYAKIAARLPSKTVRDVAMRCYWMKKREHVRRQRAEGMHMGRSMIGREERLASSSIGAHNHQLIQSEILAGSSLGVHNNQQSASSSSQSAIHNFLANQFEPISSEVWRLLEENNVILAHIAGNIGTGQMQHNGGLFNLVGSTIGTLLLGMDRADGSLTNLPPLPVSMNLDLFNAMWPNLSSHENTSRNPNLSEVPRRQSG